MSICGPEIINLLKGKFIMMTFNELEVVHVSH